jgi:hypothetical protein
LRRRKAEIRRQFLSLEEAEGKVRELVEEVYRQYTRSSEQKIADVPQVTIVPEVSKAATKGKAVKGIKRKRARAVKTAAPRTGESDVTKE